MWFISVKNRESNLDLYFKKKMWSSSSVYRLKKNINWKIWWGVKSWCGWNMPYFECTFVAFIELIPVLFMSCGDLTHENSKMAAFIMPKWFPHSNLVFLFCSFGSFYYCRVFNRFYNLKFGILWISTSSLTILPAQTPE